MLNGCSGMHVISTPSDVVYPPGKYCVERTYYAYDNEPLLWSDYWGEDFPEQKDCCMLGLKDDEDRKPWDPVWEPSSPLLDACNTRDVYSNESGACTVSEELLRSW